MIWRKTETLKTLCYIIQVQPVTHLKTLCYIIQVQPVTQAHPFNIQKYQSHH